MRDSRYLPALAEKLQKGQISRREFLHRATLLGMSMASASAFLAACGGAEEAIATAVPTQAPTQPPTQAPTQAPAATATSAPTATIAPVTGTKHGGTLTIGLQSEATGGFDPHLSSHLLSQHHFELVYEQLLRTNLDGTLSPALAESWDQIDELTYEFKLRPGVMWQHGRELTADDVKFSIERQADPETASMNQAVYNEVDQVEVIDPLTVRITTKQPFAPMISYLAAPREGNIVPADVVEEKGNLKEEMVGTGPFKFVEYVPGNEARFVRNPDYWDGDLPYLDEIVLKYITDEEARLAALRTGAVDLAYFGSASVVEPLFGDDSFEWALTKPLVTRHLVLNNKQAPLDDTRVRQAISLSLNRQEMVDVILLGYGELAAHLPPGDEFWAYPDPASLPNYTRDVDKAKALLAEAGQSGMTLPLKSGPNPMYVTEAEMIQGYLGESGINVEIVKQEQAAWVDDFWKVNHESLLMGYQSFVDPDAAFYREMHSKSDASWTNINDPRVDELIEKGRTTMDREQRQKIYWDLQELLAAEAHEIIVYAQVWAFEGLLKHVKGYAPMSKTLGRAVQLRQVWLEA